MSQRKFALKYLNAILASSSRRLLALCALLLLVGGLLAQPSSDLRSKRKKLLREIEQTSEQLETTRQKKSAAMEQLTLLQRQIRKRRELINTLQAEVSLATATIERTQGVIESLREDVTRLQQEYSHTLRTAYRLRRTNSWLSFIFSADSFNAAFRRWRYLQQYHRYRRRQTRLLATTQATLQTKLGQMNQRRAEQAELLAAAQNQGTHLDREVLVQNTLVGTLKTSESQLLTTIERQKRQHEALNQQIERAINAEIETRRRAEREQSKANSDDAGSTKPARRESDAVSQSFASNQGRLIWPADGKVTRRFGRQPHPEVPSVEINNSGIDIAVGGDTPVRVVHDGVIVTTQYMPGYRNTVLVRHGSYYTVYSNLEVVDVAQAQTVKAGQQIGRTGASGNDLHFELWRERNRLNPESWLRRG